MNGNVQSQKHGAHNLGKTLTLLFTILLAMASVAGHLFLSKLIAAGEIRIVEGQRRLEAGHSAVEEGKVDLLAGRRRLSDGKKEYAQAEDNLFVRWADKLLNSGSGLRKGREQIVEGEKQVAEGQAKVDAGEERLHAGELELLHGRERLKLAKRASVACVIGGSVFASLAIVFGFRWRRSWARRVEHTRI